MHRQNKQTHHTLSWDLANYVFRILQHGSVSFFASVTSHPVNWVGHIPRTTYSLSSPAKTGHFEFTGCGMILIIWVPICAEYSMAPIHLTSKPRTCQYSLHRLDLFGHSRLSSLFDNNHQGVLTVGSTWRKRLMEPFLN